MLSRPCSLWFISRFAVLGLVLLAMESAASANPVVTAFADRNDVLYVMQLDGTPIVPQELGLSGLVDIEALAEGPAGTLYAAVVNPIGPDELWTIDRQTLSTAAVGELGLELSEQVDLAADDAGGLWLSTGGSLYSVDTASGQAEAVGTVPNLAAIAFDGPMLYGITGTPGNGDWALVTLDPATAGQTAVSDLNLEVSGVYVFIEAMDFDAAGGMWVLAQNAVGVIDPPLIDSCVYHYDEPDSGLEDGCALLQPNLFWDSLAITGTTIPVVDVPVMDAAGAMLLALLLAGSAVVLSRRRRDSEQL